MGKQTARHWTQGQGSRIAAVAPPNYEFAMYRREAEGVPAQVKAPNTYWGIKHNSARLALGLVTPETSTLHVVAPGAGAGGVGIESSPPALHFVTFAGLLTAPAAETMNRLQTTLDLKRPAGVRLYSLQAR
jgi:hypothetical protein